MCGGYDANTAATASLGSARDLAFVRRPALAIGDAGSSGRRVQPFQRHRLTCAQRLPASCRIRNDADRPSDVVGGDPSESTTRITGGELAPDGGRADGGGGMQRCFVDEPDR